MKWPKIVVIIAVVILLFSGISIAGYSHLCLPVFKMEFPKVALSYFVNNYQLNPQYLLEAAPPIPASTKIEEIARLQRMVGRCN